MPRRMTSRLAAGLLLASCSFAVAAAQSARPTFEITSVKQNVGTAGGRLGAEPGGRFVATGQTGGRLIQYAYGLVDPQVVEGPDWLRSTKFDINAKAQGEATDAQIRIMLQSLLEDRFRLVARKEQREMPVQEIVISRDDGRLGPRLVQVSSLAECQSAAANMPKSGMPAGAIFARVIQCGSPSPILKELVYRTVGTMPIDKTGLTGMWLVSIFFAPEGMTLPRPVEFDPNIPRFSTALQEQLGLKLRSARGLVDVLTIEAIQLPTPD